MRELVQVGWMGWVGPIMIRMMQTELDARAGAGLFLGEKLIK